jgi:hypothetical protein
MGLASFSRVCGCDFPVLGLRKKVELGRSTCLGGAQVDRPSLLPGWEGSFEIARRGTVLPIPTIQYAGTHTQVRQQRAD